MKTGKITRLIRYMRRFGESKQPEWLDFYPGLAQVDWSEPSGGGGISVERALFDDPLLIFQWHKNRAIIFDDERLDSCSNWMRSATKVQRCWLTRIFPSQQMK